MQRRILERQARGLALWDRVLAVAGLGGLALVAILERLRHIFEVVALLLLDGLDPVFDLLNRGGDRVDFFSACGIHFSNRP